MRIGFVQFAPALADQAATIARLRSLLPEPGQVDLLVLPELCNSGYNFVSREQAWNSSEFASDSNFLRFLADYARQTNCHVITGFNEREGDRLYNSAILVGPNGPEGLYRKLHLFLNEKDFFAPGDCGLPLFDVRGARVGILICFDWMFPEVWRVLASRGADIICHPSNLVIPGNCQRAIPIHSLTNRVFIVTANRIGTERDLTFTGGSLITNARGKVLASAPEAEEDVTIADVDLAEARDKMVTARNHLFDDRRPDIYTDLTRSEKP